MANLLLISNGHGEDLSGALLATELRKFGHKVAAFPLVGKGNAYWKAGIRTHGFRKEFSTGGLGYTTLCGRLTELIQGQLFYLIWNLIRLFIIAREFDSLIVIGDVVPVVAAWITKKPSFVYLVAYSSHYEGKLKLPWPTKYCLKNTRFLEIYCRDKLTSDDLNNQLNRSVIFIGNPFMDPIFIQKKQLPKNGLRLAIFPGSRRPELDRNLLLILRVLETFPRDILLNRKISFDMALVDSLEDKDLINLVSKYNLQLLPDNGLKNSITLSNGCFRLNIYRNSFVQVLQNSDACLSMAGTATEQAVGLAKPVIQLPGKGPQFTSAFAESQRRLLGPTVFCVDSNVQSSKDICFETSNLILDIFDRVQADSNFMKSCSLQANLRLGSKGGTKRIAESIHNSIS